jgi:SurA-like N-terminal domain
MEMQKARGERQKAEGKRQKARSTVPQLILCLLTLSFCLFPGYASGEVIDRVLAVVSGSLITLSDVNAAHDLGLVALRGAPDPVRDVLSQLIDRELQLAEVDRYAPPEPSAADVDREVQTVRSRFPSAEAFEAVLARSGIDLAHLRETMRENLRIRGYLDQRFSASEERRQQVVADWIAGLRRRADIIDLYLVGR